MAIFPNLELEDVVQVGDKTRLNSTKTFASKDEASITLVEIEPESGNGFIDVTGSGPRDYFLDWEYSGISRTVTVSVRVTTDGLPVTTTKTIEVLTASDDGLYSDDQDLISLESDILKWVREGRNSFLDFHRKAQFLILDFLNDIGVRDVDSKRITKDDIVDVLEVRKWSKYKTLALIFEDISNATDDVFAEKRRFYDSLAKSAFNKSVLRLDLNNDGVVEDSEGVSIYTGFLSRL
jgi:hypothetical protein